MAARQDLFAALDDQLEEVRQERAALDAREDALKRARDELMAAFDGAAPRHHPPPARSRATRAGIPQKAAQHHVEAIFDYLKKHGTARQADIAKDLQLNSGTASLALRQLQDDGAVSPQDQKDRGSVVWDFVGTRRETVVHAGEGVRAGRLASR